MSKEETKENKPLEVTVDMIEHLPKFYKEVAWQYVDEGKVILKKPEETKQ